MDGGSETGFYEVKSNTLKRRRSRRKSEEKKHMRKLKLDGHEEKQSKHSLH